MRKAVKVEPTYRLQPKTKPSVSKYEGIVHDYLQGKLDNVKYSDIKPADFSRFDIYYDI